MSLADEIRSRFRGCLLGMACGDALGAGLENLTPDSVKARFGVVTDFAGGGPLAWPLGMHDDNTELALRLGESLAEAGPVNLPDVARRWLAWLDTNPPDVGRLTRDALLRVRVCLEQGRDPREAGREVWVATGGDSAGNGGLMRTAPVALRFVEDPVARDRAADEICAITHHDPRVRASCIAFCAALAGLLTGEEGGLDLKRLADKAGKISPAAAKAILGVFDLEASALPSGAYALDSLQTAFWPVVHSLPLEDGIILAVNLGREADPCGALVGALLGARDGELALPRRWLRHLREAERIRAVADRLYALTCPDPETDD